MGVTDAADGEGERKEFVDPPTTKPSIQNRIVCEEHSAVHRGLISSKIGSSR